MSAARHMTPKYPYTAHQTADFIDRAAGFVAFALPMLLSVLCSTKEPYWLDAPEFTAAAQILGIPHPPGHPLYVMLTKPFTLLPFGSIAFRVALGSAFFGAIASFLLFLICHMLIRRCAHGLPRTIRSALALIAALSASTAPGWWLQCVRQEVYTLQIALTLGALYPILRFTLTPNKANEYLLYIGAFFAGLGLSNHHFMMLAAFPAIIPQLVATARYRGGIGAFKLSLQLTGCAFLGLIPYLFLPIRAASGVPVSLGGVHAISDFFWVISAKAYQKSMIKNHLESLDVGIGNLDSIHTLAGPILLIGAVLGFYLLIRTQRTRMAGILLVLIAGITWLLRLTMGFDPYNPDYHGYFMPVVAVLSIGLAVFFGVTLHVIRTQTARGPVIATAILIILPLSPLYQAKASFQSVNLSTFRATRLFKNFCFDRVSPGSLVLINNHNLFFNLWSARFIDGSRPDLTIINPGLFGYPGYLTATLRAHKALTPLARALLVHKNLTESSVAGLALNHNIRIEPNMMLDDTVIRYMLQDGPLYQTRPEPLAKSDVSEAALEHHRYWKLLYERLKERWKEPETLRMLALSHYQDALFMARRGAREGAMKAVTMALALKSDVPEFIHLKAALEIEESGPLDIAPFLPGATEAFASVDPTDTSADTEK